MKAKRTHSQEHEMSASLISKVMHFWSCGYGLKEIRREVPQLQSNELWAIIQVQNDVATKILRTRSPII